MNTGYFSHFIGTLCMYLCLLSILVLAGYTIVHTLLLCFSKGGIRKDMLAFSTLFGILSILGLTLITVFSALIDHPLDKVLNGDLATAVFTLLCWVPALCFPTTASTGHRSMQRPLLLLPAAVYSLLIYKSGNYQYADFRFMLIVPLLLALVLTAVWYYTNKNLVVGILLALHCLLTIVLLPLCSMTVGAMIYESIPPERAGLYLIGYVFKRLFSGDFEYLYRYLMAGGIPLSVYVVLAQFTAAGIHSKRLPKEKAPLPPAPTHCPACGSRLPENSKFCNHCGKAL